MMKIYFCGSIRGGRDHVETYHQLISHLQTIGEVLTEHVGSQETDQHGKVKLDHNLSDKEIHDRDIAWLNECDVVVAEVTMPSLGVGYELGHAYLLKKPVLCLFCKNSGKNLSAMIAGARGDKDDFRVKYYDEVEEANNHITDFLKYFQT